MPSSSLHFDTAEVTAVADILVRAAGVAPVAARAVVAKGAQDIKTDAKSRISGLKHAPAYPSSITYDVQAGLSAITAEIGPDKNRRQGALGNLLEYGSTNNAPSPHMGPAAEAELPKFATAMEELAVKALGL